MTKKRVTQVRCIHLVHGNNHNLALHKAWDRLPDCYAAPEIIKQSLFQRLDSFPKISAKDHTKLHELEYLLMEIQSTKEDGYLTSLSYLDTSCGIGLIVDKLPYGIQEKWVSSGSWYKKNNGWFPPFECFCDLVSSEAKKRNDPSFIYQNNNVNSTNHKNPQQGISTPIMNLTRTAHYTKNHIHLKNVGHSETKLLTTEGLSQRKRNMLQVLFFNFPPRQRLQDFCEMFRV